MATFDGRDSSGCDHTEMVLELSAPVGDSDFTGGGTTLAGGPDILFLAREMNNRREKVRMGGRLP